MVVKASHMLDMTRVLSPVEASVDFEPAELVNSGVGGF